jgi:hypothetical protein
MMGCLPAPPLLSLTSRPGEKRKTRTPLPGAEPLARRVLKHDRCPRWSPFGSGVECRCRSSRRGRSVLFRGCGERLGRFERPAPQRRWGARLECSNQVVYAVQMC